MKLPAISIAFCRGVIAGMAAFIGVHTTNM